MRSQQKYLRNAVQIAQHSLEVLTVHLICVPSWFKSGVGTRCQTQSGASDQERNQQTCQESFVQQERQDSRAGGQCPVSQTDQESARHFWGLKKKKRMRKKKMPPVHSRPLAIRSNRGLPQYGGWLAASVKRLPEFELVRQLSRRRRQRGGRYKNPTTRRAAPSRRKRRGRRRR